MVQWTPFVQKFKNRKYGSPQSPKVEEPPDKPFQETPSESQLDTILGSSPVSTPIREKMAQKMAQAAKYVSSNPATSIDSASLASTSSTAEAEGPLDEPSQETPNASRLDTIP